MTSYKKILKDEIFDEIRRYNAILDEISDIEANNPDKSTLELLETNDEFEGLCSAVIDVQERIDSLLLETKYAPLVGLSNKELKKLRIFSRSSELQFEQNVGNYLDKELLLLGAEMKGRFKKIKPLLLKCYVSPHVYSMYRQAIKCYVEGLFDASCAMCRAVVEKIAQNFIKNSDFEREISGPNKHRKGMSYPNMLAMADIKRAIIKDFNVIYNNASKIIHGEIAADEKVNYLLIKHLQGFIREFPSPPK